MMLAFAIMTAFVCLIIIFRKLRGHIKAGWLELIPMLVVFLILAVVFFWAAFRMSADV